MNTNGVAGERGGGMDDVVLVGACVVAVGGVQLERFPLTILPHFHFPFLREFHRMLVVIHPKHADAADFFRAMKCAGDRLLFALLPTACPARDLIAAGPARLEAIADGIHGIQLRGVRGGELGKHTFLWERQRIKHRHGLLAQARVSPNGDGHYDTFLPHGLKDKDEAWEMVVVNAQGEEVYRTSDAGQPWDGSLPNGEVAKDRATYTWTVRCLDLDGTPRLFTDRLRIER